MHLEGAALSAPKYLGHDGACPSKMKILIAPDKFKGALSAREVADSIAAGLREVLPDAEIDVVPMADGGEGTAEVISQALGASWVECQAHDALGRTIEARYGWIDNRRLAVMEMSERPECEECRTKLATHYERRLS